MSKILALDIGDKNIGIAISDDELSFAFPRESIKGNSAQLLQKIKDIIVQEEVIKIIIGLPLGKDGEETPQAKKIKIFAEKLKQFKIEIVYWDERFSSKSAKNVLISSNLSMKKHKNKIHNIAASFILESYLSYLKNTDCRTQNTEDK